MFFIIRNKNSSAGEISPEVAPIYNYVKDCIEQTANYGLYVVGAKGGYYFPSKNSLDTGEAYYVLNKENLIPDKKIIESQLAAYIEINLMDCINGFEKFPTFNVSEGEISAQTSLENNKLLVNVNYPITIQRAGVMSEISEFKNIEIPTRADLLYNIASNYSNLFMETGGISLTYSSNVEDSFNVIATSQHFPDYTIVTLTDGESLDNNLTYRWRFALA